MVCVRPSGGQRAVVFSQRQIRPDLVEFLTAVVTRLNMPAGGGIRHPRTGGGQFLQLGIGQTRHRPKTRLTAARIAKHEQQSDESRKDYQAMGL